MKINNRGFSVIELTLSCALVAVAAVLISPMISKPGRANQLLNMADIEETMAQASDQVVIDLREAQLSTLDWRTLPPQVTTIYPGPDHILLQFEKWVYDPANPPNHTVTTITYKFLSNGGSTGSIWRYDSSLPQGKEVLKNVESPNGPTTIFSGDPSTNVVALDLIYDSPLGPKHLVRQVQLKG